MTHIPVMKEEVLEGLACRSGGYYVDCTLGDGGHTEGILEASSPEGRVLGIDQDHQAIEHAQGRLADFGERVILRQGSFGNVREIVESVGFERVDGILLDLGVSSNQLDEASRGFSFQREGPLDMRMDQTIPWSAADLVNEAPEDKLSEILWRFGEERWAKKIARAIVRERCRGRIDSTSQLADLVRRSIPPVARPKHIHPATRTFMALRIAVNHELEVLQRALEEAVGLLRPGGRLCVLSYHSLEDRIVKETIHQKEKGCTCPPSLPTCVCGGISLLKNLTRRPVRPQSQEVVANPRSRGAKLRVAERR